MRARPGILRYPVQIPGAPLVAAFAPSWIGSGSNALPIARDPLFSSWTPTSGPTAATGPEGPAATFNGSSNYFTRSQATTLGATGITLAARIQVASSFPTNSAIWGTGDLLSDECKSIWVQGGQWAFRMGSPFSGGKTANSSDTSYTNQWVTVVGVAYDSKVEFWINGVLSGTNSGSYTCSANETLVAGAAPSTGYYWDGKIAGGLAYNGVLSPAQIGQLSGDFWWQFRRSSRPKLFGAGLPSGLTLTVAGTASAASSSLGLLTGAAITVAGTAQAASSSLGLAMAQAITVAGAAQAATTSLSQIAGAVVTVAGTAQAATTSLNVSAGATINVAGTVSAAASSINLGVGGSLALTVAGTAQDAAASIGLTAGAAITVAGTAQAASSSLGLAMAQAITVAGAAQAATASLGFTVGAVLTVSGVASAASTSLGLAISQTLTVAATAQDATTSIGLTRNSASDLLIAAMTQLPTASITLLVTPGPLAFGEFTAATLPDDTDPFGVDPTQTVSVP